MDIHNPDVKTASTATDTVRAAGVGILADHQELLTNPELVLRSKVVAASLHNVNSRVYGDMASSVCKKVMIHTERHITDQSCSKQPHFH